MPSVSPRDADAPLVLALDVGSSSVRAMLFESQGHDVEGMEARAAYEMKTTPDGGVETDADAMVDRVAACIDDLLRRASDLGGKIGGVACSSFWHNLIGVDAGGGAVTPLYSWADTRSAPATADLRRRLDEEAVHARTGCVLHPSYLPAKLLWLSQTSPELFRRAARWMSIGEYLHLRFFGRTVCSISMASGTGLFDQHRCAWDPEVLEALSIRPDHLSPLGDLDTPLRGLRPEFASRWPALRDVPWFPAVGDGACSNIGSGCVTPERAALMVGTSGAMRVLWQAERVSIPPGLWCYRADRRRIVMGDALSEGGELFAWFRDTLRLGLPEEVERELQGMDADVHGLTILPFLAGERSPNWNAQARAAIVGLSLSTRPPQILRAALEAVAYRFAIIAEILQGAVPEIRGIVASGGALLHSPAWTQIMADVLGRPIVASAEPEASSRGAALLALEALGVLPRLQDAPVDFGPTFQPRMDRHARYREAVKKQRQLYEVLIGPRPA